MRWLRRNRGFGSYPALFALGLLLVLSFGHIHPEDLGLTDQTSAAASLNPAPSGGAPHDDDDHAHDVCAICAAMNLASTSVLPIVAALLLPVAYQYDWPADIQPAQFVFNLEFYYQARAPPQA
jgi:hypothetical protein